jgi:hypothetical protein
MEILLFALLVGGVGGYAVRGSGQKELAILKADAHALGLRLESAAVAEIEKLKAEALAIAASLKAKL